MDKVRNTSTELDVVVIGHIIIETIVFPDGSILTPVLGSPAAYSSVAMARLGNKVGLCTKVGSDMPPKLMNVFKEAGVDLEGVKTIGKYSTRNRLIYVSMEQKRVEYINKAPSFSISDLPKSYLSPSLFYICPMDFEVPPEMLEELVKTGKPIFVDLGGYGGATSSIHQFGDESKLIYLERILRSSTVIKGSFEDCGLILGKVYSSAPAPEVAYAEKLMTLGAKSVLITLGSRGVYFHNCGGGSYFQPFRCEAIDTTGAGDVFCAGLISEYIKTGKIEEAILFGEAVACMVIEKSGGVKAERMPTREEVENFIKARHPLQYKEV